MLLDRDAGRACHAALVFFMCAALILHLPAEVPAASQIDDDIATFSREGQSPLVRSVSGSSFAGVAETEPAVADREGIRLTSRITSLNAATAIPSMHGIVKGKPIMTPEILRKLEAELTRGITTEVQVVYLLAGIRKLIERDNAAEKYPALRFHCDWALHSTMNRSAARLIVSRFDDAHALLRDKIPMRALPRELRKEVDRISKMTAFEDELSHFFVDYGLSSLDRNRPDGWTHFLHLYARVIEDIPLTVLETSRRQRPHGSAPVRPQHITHVTVNCEMGRQTIKHGDDEEVFFRITWTIHDKNGQSGTIDIYNSFSLDSASR